MASIKNILKKDLPIVERYKLFFSISIAVILIGLVVGIINIFTLGNMFNVGVDFQGGYSMTVELGENRLNDSNVDEYKSTITRVAESARVGDGQGERDSRGIKISSFLRQGSGAKAGFLIRYKPVDALSGENVDIFMTELNEAIQKALSRELFGDDVFGGNVSTGTQMSASMGAELVGRAAIAVLVALLLMTVYIALRFDFVSGIAAISSLVHDVLIMLALMAIFRIEINAAFVGALIAVVGYSINNTVIIFDRIRENVRRSKSQQSKFDQGLGTEFANRSIRETLTRTFNTTVTTLIMLLLLLALGVPDIRTFLWPLVIGLVAGAYSSMCLAPTLWAKVVNKHSDFLERGAMTSNIRMWFVNRSVNRKKQKQAKLLAKKKEGNAASTLPASDVAE